MTLPNSEILRAELSYNPNSGELWWKKSGKGRKPDGSACRSLRSGYLRIHIFGRTYLAHRIAFAIFHGREPVGEIDHIDGNRLNNAIANLREASRALNALNRASSQGYRRDPRRKKNPYQAWIKPPGSKRAISLGTFPTKELAATAYAQAKTAALKLITDFDD